MYAAGEAVTGADVVTGTETYLTTLQLSPPVTPPAVTRRGQRCQFRIPGRERVVGGDLGTNLAPPGDSRRWNPATEIVNGELPVSLDGTSVTVNGKAAAVEYISPGQLNVQLPDDTALGPVPS